MAATDPLREELGGDPPPSIAALPEDQRADLAEKLAAAQKTQRRALAQAVDDGLGHVPRILRGPVKKVLLG